MIRTNSKSAGWLQLQRILAIYFFQDLIDHKIK